MVADALMLLATFAPLALPLRGYQAALVSKLREVFRAGSRAPLFTAPTGAGKTIIFTELARLALQKGNRVVVLAPYRQLVYQAAEKAQKNGLDCGIIMAQEAPRDAPLQIASTKTLHARCVRRGQPAPGADLVIVDEAHLAATKSTMEVIAALGAPIVGCTATPERGDGRGLDVLFDSLVLGPSVAELTEAGYLVPADYAAPTHHDLSGVQLRGGDYVESQMAAKLDKPKLIGDVVEHWFKLADGRKTVVFACNVAHSRHICQRFLEAGVAAEQIDGSTPNDVRRAILDRIASGETRVLVNCEVFQVGYDEPSLEVAVMARGTKSLVFWLQTIGRVLRPHPGKGRALVIDHAGSLDYLGFADEDRDWSLTGSKDVNGKRKSPRKAGAPAIIDCEKCFFAYMRADRCPRCGHVQTKRGKAVDAADGDLALVDRKKRRLNKEVSWPEKIQFYGELRQYCRDKGKTEGYAAHLYRHKFKVWPNDPRLRNAPFAKPSPQTLAWIRHRNIAYAKAKEKEAQRC